MGYFQTKTVRIHYHILFFTVLSNETSTGSGKRSVRYEGLRGV